MLVAKENDKKSMYVVSQENEKILCKIITIIASILILFLMTFLISMFYFLPWSDLLPVGTAVTDTPTDTAESGLRNTIILLGCCVFSSGWYNNGTKSTSGSSFPSSAASNIGIGLRKIIFPKNKCYEKRILIEKKTMRKKKKNYIKK